MRRLECPQQNFGVEHKTYLFDAGRLRAEKNHVQHFVSLWQIRTQNHLQYTKTTMRGPTSTDILDNGDRCTSCLHAKRSSAGWHQIKQCRCTLLFSQSPYPYSTYYAEHKRQWDVSIRLFSCIINKQAKPNIYMPVRQNHDSNSYVKEHNNNKHCLRLHPNSRQRE